MSHRLGAFLLASVLAGALILAAVPASAAVKWTSVMDMHGAKLQACKTKIDGGWRIRVRLNNASDHGHQAGFNIRDGSGDIVGRAFFNIGDRRISPVRRVVYRPGNTIGAGMAEAGNDGGGGGGELRIGDIGRC